MHRPVTPAPRGPLQNNLLLLSGIDLDLYQRLEIDQPIEWRIATGSYKEAAMQHLHITHKDSTLDYQGAMCAATDAAKECKMQDPTVISWHRQSGHDMPPYYIEANPDTWWEKYGNGNGGTLEVDVGDDYQFIFMDTGDYETLGEIPLCNLSDGRGNEYLCYTPILGSDLSKPTAEACTVLDGWFADQY